MVVDGALALAARRNVPIRYNRENVATALKAMQRFSEVKQRRERVFYKKRMEGNRERQLEADKKLVEENQHLLPRELRDVLPEMEGQVVAEQEMDVDVEMESEMDVEEEEVEVKAKVKAGKMKQQRKLKMNVGGGFERE
jgi:large subunit ribosomal protein L24e